MPRMNFLAHLYLADDDEGLRLGAMLGDYVRGNDLDVRFSEDVRRGILLHRFIDGYLDALPETVNLRELFRPPFRRYSGIIIDLAFDHFLAVQWQDYSAVSLERFDRDVRHMLERHRALLPEGLLRFMRYADRRGLFAAYRNEAEILFSLKGIGTRVQRANPLHRVADIWSCMKPAFGRTFDAVFPQVVVAAAEWRRRTETAIRRER